MKLTIRISREDDGRYIGEAVGLPGCLVYGATRADAIARTGELALRVIFDEVEHGERVRDDGK